MSGNATDPRITMSDRMWIENLQRAVHQAAMNHRTEVTVDVSDLQAVLRIVTTLREQGEG